MESYLVIRAENKATVIEKSQLGLYIDRTELCHPLQINEFSSKVDAIKAAGEMSVIEKAEETYMLLRKKCYTVDQVFSKKEEDIYTVVSNGNFIGVIRGYRTEKMIREGVNNARVRYFDKHEEAFEWFRLIRARKEVSKNDKVFVCSNSMAVGYCKKNRTSLSSFMGLILKLTKCLKMRRLGGLRKAKG